MPSNTSTDRTPAELARYYRDKANIEEQAADECAYLGDRRGQKWHKVNSLSFREQARCIMENARGGEV